MKIYRQANGAETWDKNGRCKSVELVYYVTGALDKSSAIQGVMNIAPAEENGAPLKEFRVPEFDKDKNIEIRAVYEIKTSSSVRGDSEGDAVFSFSAGGGTKHVTNAPLVKREAGMSADYVPSPGTLVGWNGENGLNFQVAGVDVPTASIKESWETEMSMSELTTSWRRKIAAATGTCNSSRFKGWERGEVLLVNCSFQGSPNSNDKVKVRFDFAIRLNEPNAQVANITLGEVEGWQYVWTIQRPDFGGSTPVVLAAYVSQVVSYSDFNSLGL